MVDYRENIRKSHHPIKLVFCKKTGQKFSFVSAQTKPEVDSGLKDLLIKGFSVNSLAEKDLNEVQSWKTFYDGISRPREADSTDLTHLDSNIRAVIIYIGHEGAAYGCVKHLTRNSILKRTGWFLLFHSNGTFNKLAEEGDAIRLNSEFDFAFVYRPGENAIKKAFVRNEEFYTRLLNIHEQENREIHKIVHNTPIAKCLSGTTPDEVSHIIMSDGRLRKTVLSEGGKAGLSTVTFEKLKAHKAVLKEEVNFNIDPVAKTVVCPPNTDKKDFIKSIVKVASLWYRTPIGTSEIWGGPAQTRVEPKNTTLVNKKAQKA